MAKKIKMLNRDMICEWLNPVLSGETSQNNPFNNANSYSNTDNLYIQTPQQLQNIYADMIENPPEWLNNDGCDDDSDGKLIGGSGNRERLGAMFINGQPVSPWSAMFGGGSNHTFQRRNVMQNFVDITNHIQNFMSTLNLQNYVADEDDVIELSNIIIQKIVPSDGGIGINIYLSFDFQKTNFFGNFFKYGINDVTGNVLICQPLKDTLAEENWIKVQGKLRNILEKWFQPKSGVYKCTVKEVIIYNQYGQIGRIKQDDIIEVIKSDKEKIQLNVNNDKWFVKTPTYWWFNYYFTLIK